MELVLLFVIAVLSVYAVILTQKMRYLQKYYKLRLKNLQEDYHILHREFEKAKNKVVTLLKNVQ